MGNVPNLRFPEFTGEWKKASLQDIATVNPKSVSLQDSFVYIDLEAVEKGELKKIQEIIRKDAPSRAQRVIYKNDILFQCVRPYQRNNYIHKIQDKSNKQWVASTGYAQIRTTETQNYIYHLLNTDGFNRKVMVRCTGSSYPAINSEDLATIRFYLATDTSEQLKISRLFDLLDERIATQNKIIEKLQSLIKGLSQQLLSSENDWILYRLDDLAQIKSGYSGTQVSYQTPYKVSRIETISKHCIDIQRIGYVECIPESYRLNVGNILFSNINSIQYIGNTAYLDKDYGLYHGMNLLRIIPNTTIVRPRFLHLLLCTDWAINHFQTICNKAVSQASINQTALGKSRFPIPPMSVQQQICSMFELTERKLDNEQEYISCLQQQKRYLLQKMFI
jgi:type I restriction enzyme S subunit